MAAKSKPTAYSNAPPWAIKIWTYPRTWPPQDIYVELATGLVTKHSCTEGALTKVLKLIALEAKNQSPLANGKSSKTKSPVPVKRGRKGLTQAEQTDIQPDVLEKFQSFLKKTGRI